MIGWLIVGALVWAALAFAAGVLIGRGIREADRRAAAARDPLADQPVEVLTPAGINARFRQIAPSRSTRSWSA